MRIALVYDTLYPESKGGVERRVWEIARRLAARGNEVHLLVPKYWQGPSTLERDGVMLRGVSKERPVHVASGRRAIPPSLLHGFGVYRTLSGERFDVVDCQTPAFPAALAAYWATRRSDTNLVVTWHESWGNDWIEEMGLLGYGGRLVERIVMDLSATHLAVSQHTADGLARLQGPMADVIHPGVEMVTVADIPPSGDIASDVLFVGRLIPKKNVELLIHATSELVSRGLNPTVLVVGEGPARARLTDEVQRLGLQEAIRFVGRVEDWKDLVATIRATRVLALPSLREGYGMIVQEAAAYGVPTVTVRHRRNAAAEFVNHGVTGFIVPPIKEDFADALGRLLSDEPGRADMGERARDAAAAYNWDSTVEATERAYSRGFRLLG